MQPGVMLRGFNCTAREAEVAALCELGASLVYIENFRTVSAVFGEPVLKKSKNQTKKQAAKTQVQVSYFSSNWLTLQSCDSPVS